MKTLIEALRGFFGAEKLTAVQSATVGIAGAGGLGSNCAAMLARSGVRKFVIVDLDVVEASNLNRQFFFLDQLGQPKVEALKTNLLRIDPSLEITALHETITRDTAARLFANCGVVVEAFDKPENKQMLAEIFMRSGKLYVSASGLAGCGNADAITTRRMSDDFYLVGDRSSAVSAGLPPCSPRVNVAAAKEADVVLDCLLGGPASRRAQRRKKIDHGLYCITGEEYSAGRPTLEVARQLVGAGVKIIQYREKDKSGKERYADCRAIREITAARGVTFIVNDDAALARAVAADGVHIGQDDMPIEEVRHLVGDDMVIGLSTHSPEQAADAVRRGADYIGVGPLYATKTKKDVCAAVGLEYLDHAVRNVAIPFVAIGGIKLHNIDTVLSRGARCVAMVTEIIGAPDIAQRVAEASAALARYGLEL